MLGVIPKGDGPAFLGAVAAPLLAAIVVAVVFRLRASVRAVRLHRSSFGRLQAREARRAAIRFEVLAADRQHATQLNERHLCAELLHNRFPINKSVLVAAAAGYLDGLAAVVVKGHQRHFGWKAREESMSVMAAYLGS
jgi:hypothetical protein